jgi:hypothetical protein
MCQRVSQEARRLRQQVRRRRRRLLLLLQRKQWLVAASPRPARAASGALEGSRGATRN